MTKSTRASDNSGHSFEDAQIADRVREEPSEEMVRKIGLYAELYDADVRAVIAVYRNFALRGE